MNLTEILMEAEITLREILEAIELEDNLDDEVPFATDGYHTPFGYFTETTEEEYENEQE